MQESSFNKSKHRVTLIRNVLDMMALVNTFSHVFTSEKYVEGVQFVHDVCLQCKENWSYMNECIYYQNI